MGFKYPPISFMLYVISIFLIICFESKGTFFIWNTQENREKSFRKSYNRRGIIIHISPICIFQISHSCLWIYLVQQSIQFELCTSSYTFAMMYSNIHNKCSKNYKINPHGFFYTTFCPCSNYFCTFAAYTYCVHFKRYKSHNRYKWNIPYACKTY